MKHIKTDKVMRLEYDDICCSSPLTYNQNGQQKLWSDKFIFHTSACIEPFVIFDLKKSVDVLCINVENRDDIAAAAERGRWLKVHVSEDALSWRPLAFEFDVLLTEAVIDVRQRLRFIRFSLDGVGILHLKSIDVVMQEVEANQLLFGSLYKGDYYLTHSHGFFSCCSTLMMDMARLQGRQNSISTKFSFDYSRDKDLICVLSEYFLPPDESVKQIESRHLAERLYHHSRYYTLPFVEFKQYLDKYFRVNDKVQEIHDYFVDKYDIDPANTIALSYRGTDKHIEVDLQPIEIYIEHARALQERDGCRVLVQTDQQQVRDLVMRELKNSFFLDELPVTAGNQGIHLTMQSNRVDFSQKMLAAVKLMASCKHLITHTGNVALWTVLYRGNVNNTIQI